MEIYDGQFFYHESSTPINYSIIKVNIKSPGIYWNSDTINIDFSMLPGTGSGDLKGQIAINLENLNYDLNAVATRMDLGLIEQYLKDLASYGNFSANIDANIKAKGNFKSSQQLYMSGKLAINDFHFGKNKDDDFAAFEKLKVEIIELDPEHKKYFFDSVFLAKPYFKFEKYDSLDNIQRMFGEKGANIKVANAQSEKFNLILEIAKYIKVVFQNILKSDYKVNSLNIQNGNIQYNDYSLSEKFSLGLKPFNIRADSVDNTNPRVRLNLESGIKPYGNVSLSVAVDPQNINDFEMRYKFEKIAASAFNPYLINYTEFPLERGTIELYGNWKVRNDVIESNNHFILVDAKVSKRIRRKETQWIPLPLIMAFVRERGNVIDYKIPITGNLKDPSFHFSDVIFDLLGNIFIKPVTTPYRVEVRNVELKIEESISLKWAMQQTKLNNRQQEFVAKIVEYLVENPTAQIIIQPFQYIIKEKEYILLFEAKKKFYFSQLKKQSKLMTEEDSVVILKMTSRAPAFLKYLNEQTNDAMLFTIQDKCLRLLGNTFVNNKLDQLLAQRVTNFTSYFLENKINKQFKFIASDNTIPFNGFSYFKINYKGEIPKSLSQAYGKLLKLNNEYPREEYSKFRKNKSN